MPDKLAIGFCVMGMFGRAQPLIDYDRCGTSRRRDPDRGILGATLKGRSMKTISIVGIAVLFWAVLPAEVQPQALTSLQSLRVSYSTRKATVRPEGDLKAAIDAIDREIAEATRQGRNGEVRHLIAKGQVLLSGRSWTDVLDYSNSLVLRTDRVVADSAKRYTVRIEQIYAPAIELQRSLK